MADSSVSITAGSGTTIDTRTESTNSHHRQVVVIGDPATNAGVAPVDATNGLAVDVKAIAAGTNAIGKLAANSGVDIGDVDVTSVVPGTGATNLGKAEDAAHASADVGVMALAVQTATPINRAGTDGDYEPLQISAGRLWTSATIDAAIPAGTNAIGKLAANSGVDIGDVDVTSIAAGDNNIGNVDIVTVPTDPFGANADAASATGSISAKLRFIAATGIPITSFPDNEPFNIAQMNGVTVTMGNGISGTGVQRVTIASDSTGQVALAAGTNGIGKLTANSGVDIGDVDVTSIATGTNAIGRVGHDTTGLGHGVTTVTTAGTDVALAASTACKWVQIQAQTDNTNKIAVGATGVDATVATGNGIILDPGDVVTIPIDNLADVFIDSLVNGEGVRYMYGT